MTTRNGWLSRLTPATALRRMGWGVFAFFLVKGLLWLIVPTAVAVWAAQ